MFTGLIEATGIVGAITPSPAGVRLRIDTELARSLTLGESVAVNGVCLTAVAGNGPGLHADVSPETLRVTTLGQLGAGAVVNLERSLRADAKVGGHFVQGHVDATGIIEDIRPEGESYRITFGLPAGFAPYLVQKGSIAVDGISLTIASLQPDGRRFDVQIIPFTWAHTNLRTAAVGGTVNIECDILGKYVVRALELRNVSQTDD